MRPLCFGWDRRHLACKCSAKREHLVNTSVFADLFARVRHSLLICADSFVASYSRELMKLRLLYHGHCFDGVASAATFTRFYKERIHPEAEVNYAGLLHRPGNLFDLDAV